MGQVFTTLFTASAAVLMWYCTLKVAGRDQVMQIIDYLDNMEEEFHKFYPDDSCPMVGGYKARFERFVIESLGAELDNQREI